MCCTALPAAVDVGIQHNSKENVATLVPLHLFVCRYFSRGGKKPKQNVLRRDYDIYFPPTVSINDEGISNINE
jgi:hypothetical protein